MPTARETMCPGGGSLSALETVRGAVGCVRAEQVGSDSSS